MKNENKNENVEKVKESKWEKVKAFGKKIGKTACKVGVVVLAFGAGIITAVLIQGKNNASSEADDILQLPSDEDGIGIVGEEKNLEENEME